MIEKIEIVKLHFIITNFKKNYNNLCENVEERKEKEI
jgi:hypothetical protein